MATFKNSTEACEDVPCTAYSIQPAGQLLNLTAISNDDDQSCSATYMVSLDTCIGTSGNLC